MRRLSHEKELAEAVAALAEREPRFGTVVAAYGLPSLRLVPPGLASLLRIVTDQLISLKAGDAIWRRIEAHLQVVEPEAIRRCGEDGLRQLGLTGAKARTFLALAEAQAEGLLVILDDLDDSEAAARLTRISGIGPWTADIYLLTALGRINAWPTGDLALQTAAMNLFRLEQRPTPKQMNMLAEHWQPWRSAAARLLWSHYRGMKGLPQART